METKSYIYFLLLLLGLCLTVVEAGRPAVAGTKDKPIYDVQQAPLLFMQFVRQYDKSYEDLYDTLLHYEQFRKNLIETNIINQDPRPNTAHYGIGPMFDHIFSDGPGLG